MLGGFLRRLTGGGGSATGGSNGAAGRLVTLLADYSAWHVPHLGTNGVYPGSAAPRLTEAEFRANLHAYRDAMPARIAHLASLLDRFGLDLAEAYDEQARDPFIRLLHLMLLAELPAAYRADLAVYPAWEASPRSGAQIVYSLLGDIAMLFADVLLKAKPGCFVGMDLDPEDRTMTSHGRPCLLGLSDGLFPGTHRIYDFEDEMFGVFRRMKEPTLAFADAAHVHGDVGGALIGNSLLEACGRDRVEPDLAERRAEGWMARAV